MPFDLQPTLTGRLVRLRPLLPGDYDALFAVASDPLIWEQHPDKARSQPEGFRKYFDGGLASGGAFLITDAATGAAIGSSRFHGYNPAAGEIEIGWTFLARSHWGGDYNRELKELMLRHAFRFVRRVLFFIHPENHRSQRAIVTIGAVRLAEHPDSRGDWVFRIDAQEHAATSSSPRVF